MSLKDNLDKSNLPSHIAVIMDGNGRWAKKRGKMRLWGHRHGVESVRSTIEAAAELEISYLTLYAFSAENWDRPQEEVSGLMELFIEAIEKETPKLIKNNISLRTIGETNRFSEKVKLKLNRCIEETSSCTGLTVILALSYSGQWDILEAVKGIVAKSKKGQLEAVTREVFESHLSTAGIPHPELMIRTSGECRMSNFLLWQLAYAELYFTEVNWPDFSKEEFYRALAYYQSRERRFGKTSEQI
ncbi:MAG: isoprenyl transferase [Bacteroidales bacterium]|jgi:undecaprenyl diphosphate synthase|nr:isoprenyl transferase [Bacteroidales bacterium]